MVWQLRLVVAIAGMLVVSVAMILAVSTWRGRPRSSEEGADRLRAAKADRVDPVGELITATWTGSTILSAVYVAMALGAAAFFLSVAVR